jgi:glycosyltransferase involved in cell wall biosynthesis
MRFVGQPSDMPESSLNAGVPGDGLHLLVVIPCLDEAPTVGRVVADVPRNIPGIGRVHIVVIDDGSSDGTGDRAREAGAEVVRHHTTRGLGATFQEAVGIAIARNADVLLHIDGDGQFDPGDIPLLVKPVVDHDAHMATASRFLDQALAPTMPAVKRWGNRGVAGIVRLLTGRRCRTHAGISLHGPASGLALSVLPGRGRVTAERGNTPNYLSSLSALQLT